MIFPLFLPITRFNYFYQLNTTFSITSANQTRHFHYLCQSHTTYSLLLPITHDIFINYLCQSQTIFPLLLLITHDNFINSAAPLTMNYLHTSKKDFKRYSMLALFKNCIRAYCIWMFNLLAKITKYRYLSLCFNHHPAKEVSRKSISASIQIQLWRTYSISHSHVREAIVNTIAFSNKQLYSLFPLINSRFVLTPPCPSLVLDSNI